MGLTSRIQHAWNAFMDKPSAWASGPSTYSSPTRRQAPTIGRSTFVASVYNRIAIDVSMAKLRHVKVDPLTEDVAVINSGLNYCLNTEANIDQTSLQFMQDIVYSMFDEGCIAVVPVDTTSSPLLSESYDIKTMRVGKIVQWYPQHVAVMLYNEKTGQNEEVTVPKKTTAIIENPLFAVMNSENSTLKQLIKKLALQDDFDQISSSGRLDMFIQVPYGIKTNVQKKMAEDRIKAIEDQLASGKHGISYLDSTEKITQLNRPLQTQLPETIDRLTKQFYNQLGLTQTIFDGTATEAQLKIYYSRTIDPIIENVIAEFSRKFITRTARTQGHEIQYYRDMFKFITVEAITSLGDTVRRNSIMTGNEVRKILGLKPSNDIRADELYNPNIADVNQMPTDEMFDDGSLTPPDTEEAYLDE